MRNIRFTALIIAVVMILTSAAFAESLPVAAKLTDTAGLEKYASFTLDETSGEWSVNAYQADAALMYLRSIVGSYYDGILYMYPSIEGNSDTGMLLPVLNVMLTGSSKRVGDATVSVAVNGKRYDFIAPAGRTAVSGRYEAETYRLPLDAGSVSVIADIAAASEMDVLICGGNTFTFEIKNSYKNPNSRELLYQGIFDAFGPMAAELDTLDFAGYALNELNSVYWKNLTGQKIECDVSPVTGAAVKLADMTIPEPFEAYYRGNRGENVRKLQQLMIKLGFLTGKEDTLFGESLEKAVKSAQKYFGVQPTGLVDEEFLTVLMANNAAPAAEKTEAADAAETLAAETEAKPGVTYVSANNAAVRLDRAWFCRTVTVLNGNGGLAEKSVSNSDNVFVAVDGILENLSADEMKLYSDVTGTVSAGGYTFEIEAAVERDNGTRFDTSLMPMNEGRLVLYAEVPERFLNVGTITGTLKIGTDTISFTVEP